MVSSTITGKMYDPDNVVYIPNMQQNYFYFSKGLQTELLDIVLGGQEDNKKIIFIYPKNDKTRAAYREWNIRART